MTYDETNAGRYSPLFFLQATLCLALLMTIGGLIYASNTRPEAETAVASTSSFTNAVITGSLRVSYTLIDSSGTTSSEFEASRVEYFPTYVLVTQLNDTVTTLWSLDRLAKLDVTRTGPVESHGK